MSMKCEVCGGTEFDYDHIRGEHICRLDGFTVQDRIDRADISGFFNSEGKLERKIGANQLGSDHTETFKKLRDYSGKSLPSNKKDWGRRKKFNRNIMIERTPLRIEVEKYIKTMSGNGLVKSIAKKIISHTHSTEAHNEKMGHTLLWAEMKNANDGNDVSLPLNETRHAQKMNEKDTRNGNYTVRMVSLAAMTVASRIVNEELNTKQIAKQHDVQHNHLINESRNIVNYLRIIWVALGSIDTKENPDLARIITFPPGHLFNRSWSDKDINSSIDLLRTMFEQEVGTRISRKAMKRLEQMLNHANKHRYLCGENINLVATAFAFRISKALNPKFRLKSRICSILGIKPNRIDRLESQFSNVLDKYFSTCWKKEELE
ncbi:MAG: hypothetical protein CMB31_04585 [Euryarchaeota archaeon]|nr:hypothetical protein [Euryarchaeota archaeon]